MDAEYKVSDDYDDLPKTTTKAYITPGRNPKMVSTNAIQNLLLISPWCK